MALESALHIDELNPASPTTSDDPFGTNAVYLELQQLKTVVTTDFANISGAVTASDVELNYLDITTLGTTQNSKAVTQDASGNINAASTTWSNLGAVTTVEINGGTVDAASIGATTPAAGAFTTLSSSGLATLASLTLASGATVTAVLDEDAMGSDSATALATQQSIKAYVDNVGYATEAYADARGFYVISAVIEDISTAGTVYVPMSMAGIVTRVDTVLGGTIATADAGVSLTTSSDQGMANLTIAFSGSGAGDVDSDTTINNSTVSAGTYLKLVTDGASTNAVPLYVSILVDIS